MVDIDTLMRNRLKYLGYSDQSIKVYMQLAEESIDYFLWLIRYAIDKHAKIKELLKE